MLSELKFVQGAVAKKDFTPALTHFRIKNRQVVGYNGILAISSPIAVDLDIAPKAAPFVKAINACSEAITLHLAKNGKLVVQSGNFTAHVDCIDVATFPDIRPSGRFITLPAPILPALRKLEPFIGEDASRPWACAILLDGQSAFATNNVVLAEYWLGFDFPCRVSVAASTIRELLRIGEEPTKMQLDENRISFHYEDGRWITTQLLAAAWPDLRKLLDRCLDATPEPIDPGFWLALEQVVPFVEDSGRCYLLGDRIATTATPELAGVSALVACPPVGCYNARLLAELAHVATSAAFAAYPEPVPFFGENVRGIIAGVRQT